MIDGETLFRESKSAAEIEGREPASRSLHGWLSWVVRRRLDQDVRRKRSRARATVRGTIAARAQTIVRRTSLKAALSGAASGSLTTGAGVVVAESKIAGALVAIPLALAGVLGEMVLRTMLHVDMAADLADTFGVPLNPSEAHELWHMYTVVFGPREAEEGDETGASLLTNVMGADVETLRDAIGEAVLGESMLRNVVPFVSIATSAASSFWVTWRLGHVALRCVRYRRAIDDALSRAPDTLRQNHGLLVEAIWHLAIADGPLTKEETVGVAHLLRKLPPASTSRTLARLDADPSDFLARLGHELSASDRAAFARLVEVAAAAAPGPLSERQKELLARIAGALRTTIGPGDVMRMKENLLRDGVL